MSMIRDRWSLALLALLSIVALGSSGKAKADMPSAVERAEAFLNSRKQGELVLSYVHAGADYHAHHLVDVRTVVDADGTPRPGQFALTYEFNWEDDGITDVRFFFNSTGGLYAAQVVWTNAVLQVPYLYARVGIQALANVLLQSVSDQLDAADLKRMQAYIDQADAQQLMLFALQVRQLSGL